jgi:hypothetical protein
MQNQSYNSSVAVDRLGFHTLHVRQTINFLCFGLDDAVCLFLLKLTDSVNLKGTPVNLTRMSINLTEATVNLTGISVNLTGISVNLTGVVVNATEVCANLIRISVNLIGISVNLITISVNLTGVSINLIAIFDCRTDCLDSATVTSQAALRYVLADDTIKLTRRFLHTPSFPSPSFRASSDSLIPSLRGSQERVSE